MGKSWTQRETNRETGVDDASTDWNAADEIASLPAGATVANRISMKGRETGVDGESTSRNAAHEPASAPARFPVANGVRASFEEMCTRLLRMHIELLAVEDDINTTSDLLRGMEQHVLHDFQAHDEFIIRAVQPEASQPPALLASTVNRASEGERRVGPHVIGHLGDE